MPRKKQVATVTRTPDQSKLALKKKVRLFYDLQRLRLQTQGRTLNRAHPIDLHEVDQTILEARMKELHTAEKHALGDIHDHLKALPFYTKVLSDKVRYRGIGPTMAGVILAEFRIEREDTASKMWAFAGLAPVNATRCALCHDVLTELGAHPKASKCPGGPTYASGKAMRPTKGEKLPYNAFLKMKLVGVLGPVMLKVGSPWRSFYDDYKHRKQSAGWGKSDGHRHNAAIRYMVKMLLLDIWKEWRAHEGLPVRPSYQEEKLGHVHGQQVRGPQMEHASQGRSDPQNEHASHPSHDAQDIHASRSPNGHQPQDASHQSRDARAIEASHCSGDAQNEHASPPRRDPHNQDASRIQDVPQAANASRSHHDAQHSNASHSRKAPRKSRASQLRSAAHQESASRVNRPLTVNEATAMFGALDDAEDARRERAERHAPSAPRDSDASLQSDDPQQEYASRKSRDARSESASHNGSDDHDNEASLFDAEIEAAVQEVEES